MKRLFNILAIAVAVIAFSCQQISAQDKPTISKEKQAMWKKKLTAEQYDIMVNKGTEPPFHNAYWNNHQKGIYVSAATGEVLFSSADKFDSGTGWPSFVKPVEPNKVAYVHDNSFGMDRTEVIEKSTGLHLGHVFNDGPPERGGKRFCMNSAALKFIKQ